MFPFSNVIDFFLDEFARLRARRLPFSLVLHRSLASGFIILITRHSSPPF
jgi:hypothetical protein